MNKTIKLFPILPLQAILSILSKVPAILEILDRFWRQHPALLFGLALLLGAGVSFTWNASLLMPLGLLWLPLLLPDAYRQHGTLIRRVGLTVPLFFGMLLYCQMHYLFPPEGIYKGFAEVSIYSVSAGKSPFGDTWQYKGTVKEFVNAEGTRIARHLPVQITTVGGAGTQRQKITSDYLLAGKLKVTDKGYALNVSKNAVWTPIEGSWSAAEMRCRAKEAVIGYIHAHIDDGRAATFLAGLATGDFSDRQIRFSLGRFGLQHILAISGFHFAIVAASLCVLMGLLLPRKVALGAVMVLLCGYFVFLGPGPSIMRAWLTIAIALVGQLIDRRCRGLNALGVALTLMLLFDPYACQQIGFQLSFLAAASIVGLYSASDQLLQRLWPKRSLGQMAELPWWQQHGYALLAVFRQAMALNIAVHVVMVPVCLFYFYKLPWLSFIFNLFFPFLVSVSMLLLIAALVVHPLLPFVANWLHVWNNEFTARTLDLTFNMPAAFDFMLRVPEFSPSWLVVYLSLLAIGMIRVNHKTDFAF